MAFAEHYAVICCEVFVLKKSFQIRLLSQNGRRILWQEIQAGEQRKL